MENRNTILAIVLMLAVWIGFNWMFPAKPGAPVKTEVGASQTVEQKEINPQTEISKEKTIVVPVVDTQAPIRDIRVENDDIVAVFSTVGGRLKTLELKNYKEKARKDAANQSIVKSGSSLEASLATTGTDSINIPSTGVFVTDLDSDQVKISGADTKTISFRLVLESGLVVEKIYKFSGTGYAVDLNVRLINGGTANLSGNMNLELVQPWDESMKGGAGTFVGPSVLSSDKVHRVEVQDLKEATKNFGKETLWGGFQMDYFFSGAVPLNGAAEKVSLAFDNGLVHTRFQTPYLNIAPGQISESKFILYHGPNDFDILEGVGHQLEKVIDFGFFAVLAKPLFHVLKFFHSYVLNFGVAIILLTVIIKLLFWPLTQKSYASMKNMQKLQPEMARIKEKYKNDRDKMNREMMEFYKNNKVNPLGGCLPMIIQIPVFFALYQVLLHSIDLRHAPFILWITDLSAKDPFYITPIVMGGTMFLQQKMTPSNMDPMQAKIFMAMPLIFTAMFLNFPSGLVIYWLTNNILTILQQYLINRKA